ncbi:MAG: flagellar motor protein [Thermodesulfovibrionales bacterium]|nr:flagellar motor protein [Thermodesulfovibrionales bacterium]
MDIASFLGLLIGFLAIAIGNFAEGGQIGHLLQVAAAMIVFGGTFGAVLLSYSLKDILDAFRVLKKVFTDDAFNPHDVIDDILSILTKARKMGLIALENEINAIEHPFLKRGLGLIIDGMQPVMVKEVLSREIDIYEEYYKRISKIYESAGGFAPTIGILGAVLGLIHVMQNVTDPSKIGGGIAVAFVATIYGVGSANLVFIPIAKKIQNKVKRDIVIMEMIIEGIMGIESGLNPYFLKNRLNAFLDNYYD